MLGAENKDLGAASQTSLTEVKLRLRRKILFTQNPVLQIFEFNGELRASWVFMFFFGLSSNWIVRIPPHGGICIDLTSIGFRGAAVSHATKACFKRRATALLS